MAWADAVFLSTLAICVSAVSIVRLLTTRQPKVDPVDTVTADIDRTIVDTMLRTAELKHELNSVPR